MNEGNNENNIQPEVNQIEQPQNINPTPNQTQINQLNEIPKQETPTVQPVEPVQNVQPINPVPEQLAQSQSQNIGTPEPKKKNKNKKPIIIIIIVLLLAAIATALYFFLKPEDKKKTTNDNKKSNETAKNDDNEIEPEVEPEEEPKEDSKQINNNGKKIDIYTYKYSNNDDIIYDYNIYTDRKSSYEDRDTAIDKNSLKKVGSITCLTEECEPVGYAYSNKYVLINESNDTLSLYDYTNNKLIYNSKKSDYYTENSGIEETSDSYGLLMDNNNNAYGFFENYQDNDVWYTNIYSLLSNKYYSKIEGASNIVSLVHHSSVINKRYYPVTLNYGAEDKDEKDIIIDLTTGKKISTLNGVVNEIIELKNGSYILVSGEKGYICDINGNVKIDNVEAGAYNMSVYYNSNKLVVTRDKKFYVYDSNLKLIKTSKAYKEILIVDKDYVLVLDGTKLQLVDHNDKILTTFFTDYNEDKYTIHTLLSGWYTDQGKNGIYIVVGVKNANIKYEDVKKYNKDLTKENFDGMDKGYEYYYIPTTNETGKIPTVIGGYAKPVLYLYPTKKTKVTINFEHEDMLTTTYPKFNKEWVVTANPNGDLYDKKGNYYYALYWEENGNHKVDFSEGFYVEKENAIEFLEEKLEYIGLNSKERNEFIMYWLPILEKNKKNLVYFELTEERNSYNKIKINPQPDSLLRIAIHVKKVNKKTNIKEQKLTKFNRTGFSAIEWGGVQYK